MPEEPRSQTVEIASEEQLETYLIGRIEYIMPGGSGDLTLVGNQVRTPVGVIDILLKRRGNGWRAPSGLMRSGSGSGRPEIFVVIELKVGTADESAVGQILKYMGYYREVEKKDVEGYLIAKDYTDAAIYASKNVSNLKLLSYVVDIRLDGAIVKSSV
jgi:RecB family endonuclease NucS